MIVHNIGEGPKMERGAFQLENYRPLPLLRTGPVADLLTLARFYRSGLYGLGAALL
jgi:hypothetical protein